MSANTIWDDPEINSSGDFVTFEAVGDEVVGTILAITKHTWPDGKVCPQIELDTDAGPKTLTAGQIRLKVALAEQRPEVGDRVRIRLTQVEKRAGGKTLKHFQVDVHRAGAQAPAPVAPVAPPVAVPPVAAAPAPSTFDGPAPF